MKIKKSRLIFLLAVSVVLADGNGFSDNALVAGNTAFALDVYSVLRHEEGNIFFSPYSISSALAMTYAGARGNTAAEMAKTLHFTFDNDNPHPAFARLDSVFRSIESGGKIQLRIANSLWPQKGYPFLTDFLESTKRYYHAEITPVDFMKATDTARRTINTWVEKQTNDKIPNFFSPGSLAPNTVMVLVNAIYFKGNWANQFDPKYTADAGFSNSGGAKTTVAMMYQEGRFGYGEIDGAKLLELPYEGNELSMVIVLPDTPDGLSKVEDHLSPENLESWLSGISARPVEVYLPRFKITWGAFELTKPLMSLGMHSAFGMGADFSGMDGTKSLFIKSVFHKALIEVTEEGTEAAAVTGVVMAKSLSKIYAFKADHPFLFLIRDNQTGSLLFLGRMLDPEEG